jgi:hypothetical protein
MAENPKLKIDLEVDSSGVNKGMKEASKDVSGLGDTLKGLGDSLKSSLMNMVPFSAELKSAGSLLTTLRGAMTASTVATNLFKVALVSTGIGAIVVALGSLIAYLTTTQVGMDKLRQVTEPVAQIFQRLLGVLQTLGESTFKAIAQLINGDLREGFKTLGNGFKAVGSGVKNAFTGGIAAGKELAALTVQIEEAQNDMILSQARLNRQIAEQQEVAMDATRSEVERQSAAKKAVALISERTKLENGLLDLQIKKIKLEQEANDTDRKGYAEANTLIAKKEENEARAASERRRLNNIANKAIIADDTITRAQQLEINKKFIEDTKVLARETPTLNIQIPEDTMKQAIGKISSSIEIAKAKGAEFSQYLADFSQGIQESFGANIQNTIGDFAASIGSAMATGGNVLKAAGGALLRGVSNLLGDFGKQLIAFGVAGLAYSKLIKSIFTDPLTAAPKAGLAIAAGAALLAISAGIGSTMRSNAGGGGGGGGGYSGESTTFAGTGASNLLTGVTVSGRVELDGQKLAIWIENDKTKKGKT